MYNTINCLLKYLNTKGVSYFIGNKVRDDVIHSTNKKKKRYISVSIITSIPQEKIEYIFQNNIKDIENDCIKVRFGLYEIKLFSYSNFYNEKNALDKVRAEKDFTINTLLMDEKENIIDYSFKYKNHKISALNDLNGNIIRVVGNPSDNFKKNPIRMLKAFRLMSTLGYEIEEQTLLAINKYKNLLTSIDKSLIVKEFNKLIRGKNIAKTLLLMSKLNIFDLKIEGKYDFFPFIKSKRNIKLCVQLNKHKKISLIELYATLFYKRENEIDIQLKPLQILNDEDIEKVKWLVNNFTLLQNKDLKLRVAIYNSIDGIVKEKKIPLLKELLHSLTNIYKALGIKIRIKDVMFALCSRPYFYEQLEINDETIINTFYKLHPNEVINLNDTKDRILYKLITLDRYPTENALSAVIGVI
jgi:tRNA nucleotidyltransferase/poly(A) polymerase